MRRQHRFNLIIWLALLLSAAIEFGASFLSIPAEIRPVLILPAVMMASLVSLGYMRLPTAPDLAKAFAIAGVFWLTILLGLAMTDPLTRAIYPVAG
jgi:caa(3)-type oxidase subunit IV